MSATSGTSTPGISTGTCAATSSRESASGTTPSNSPAGPPTGPSGPDPARANLSARQAAAAGRLTSAIFGPRFSTSSNSAALQSSLASRLRARTASTGSTLFTLTWKVRTTTLGRSISALRASAPRTFDSVSGSWPTPRTSDMKGPGQHGTGGLDLRTTAQFAAWPTCSARDWKGAPHDRWGSNARPLNEVARLASWATPAAKEAGGSPEQFLARKEKARANGAELGVSLTSLSLQAQLAGWPTPMAGTPAQNGNNEAGNTDSSRRTVHLASGPIATGSPVETEKPGQLNAGHSRWLQALPVVWDEAAPLLKPSPRFRTKTGATGSDGCAATATRSTRKPRKSSSRPPLTSCPETDLPEFML